VDFYDVLELDYDATGRVFCFGVCNMCSLVGEIKFNYRKLQKQFHPDVSGENDRSSVLNEAYQNLVDPNLRAQYDRKLSAMPLSQRPIKRGFKDQPGLVGPLSEAELVMKQSLYQANHSSKDYTKYSKSIYFLS